MFSCSEFKEGLRTFCCPIFATLSTFHSLSNLANFWKTEEKGRTEHMHLTNKQTNKQTKTPSNRIYTTKEAIKSNSKWSKTIFSSNSLSLGCRVSRDSICLRNIRRRRCPPGGGSVQSGKVEVLWMWHEPSRESEELGMGRM